VNCSKPYQTVQFLGSTSDFGIAGVATPSADFDSDGDIDGSDFLVWQRGFGTPAPNAIKSDGDADNDEDVDRDDLSVWESQYGTTPQPLVVAIVSEQVVAPGSALLTSEPAATETDEGLPLATTVSSAAFSTNIWLTLPSVSKDNRLRTILDDNVLPNQLSVEQIDSVFDRLTSATSRVVTSVESLLVERADESDNNLHAVDEVFEEWDLLGVVPD
jgi:hypothetical protein